MLLEVVDREKNITEWFYHLKVGNPIFREFFMFLNPQREWGQLEGLMFMPFLISAH